MPTPTAAPAAAADPSERTTPCTPRHRTPTRRLTCTPGSALGQKAERVSAQVAAQQCAEESIDFTLLSPCGLRGATAMTPRKGGSATVTPAKEARRRASTSEPKSGAAAADENSDPARDYGFGSRSTLTPVRASRKQMQRLGSDTVLTPVRRSSRIRYNNNSSNSEEGKNEKDASPELRDLLQATNYAYMGNISVIKEEGQ